MSVIVAMLVIAVVTPVVGVIGIMIVVPRCVLFLVPIIANEIDGSSARVIFGAMLAPVFFMTGRNMQINRLCTDDNGRPWADDRLGVDHRGSRDSADVDLSKKARLANSNRDADVTRDCRGGDSRDDRDNQKMLHVGELLCGAMRLRIDTRREPLGAARYCKANIKTVKSLSECRALSGIDPSCRRPQTCRYSKIVARADIPSEAALGRRTRQAGSREGSAREIRWGAQVRAELGCASDALAQGAN